LTDVRPAKRLFELGRVSATPTAMPPIEKLAVDSGFEPAEVILHMLHRHQTGDWGDVDRDDARANDLAVKNGERILSSYSASGVTIWVITEADRSHTTLLLPEDY
jgi:hypothetical protein